MSLAKIQLEKSRHLDKEELKIEKRKSKLINDNPNIKRIEDEINALDFKRIMLVLKNENNIEGNKESTLKKDLEKIELQISKLQKEKEEEIEKLKLPKDYFEIKYNCNICKDKGYIKEGNKTVRCKCITQKLIDEKYNSSNLSKNNNETFNNFNLSYYSDINEENKKSPRENMEEILKISKDFVKKFGDENNKNIKNLLFTGKTGLGKTFLSNAIAKEILKKNYTIYYQTASTMFDDLMMNKFKDQEIYYDMREKINNVDLLIIDDFGTENLSEAKMKEIFSIINLRIIKNKSTLISTNLSLKALADYYDDRIVSRIIGNFTIKQFYGKDIRTIKKKIKKEKNINE